MLNNYLAPITGITVALTACLSFVIASSPISAQDADPHRHHREQFQALQQSSQPATYSSTQHRYAVPDVPLIDSTGESIGLLEVLDHDGPLLMQFMFTTCPGVCPALSAILSSAQTHLGGQVSKVRMVSISIDPDHDTPEILTAYAERFKAENQWRFLTGTLDDVVAAQKAFGAYRGNKMRHEPLTFLRHNSDAAWIRFAGFIDGETLAGHVLGAE